MTAAQVVAPCAQQDSLGSTAGEMAKIASKKGCSQAGQDLPSLPMLLVLQALTSWPLMACKQQALVRDAE